MKLKSRATLLIAVGLVLVLLNLWRWVYTATPAVEAERASAGQASSARDFVVRAYQDEKLPPATRNPFQPKIVAVAKAAPKPLPPPPPPGPAPKTAEELEADLARTELAAIKLVGVVFKNDKPQAFLVKGDQVFLAIAGEKVAGRFTVDSITGDSVTLSDPKTAVSGRLSMAGS